MTCSFFACQEKKKQTPAKPSDVKRTRRDRTEMENIIFKLFERQPNWALKALVQETDQPEVFFWDLLYFCKEMHMLWQTYFNYGFFVCCPLRAQAVTVYPQLCAAIPEGDTEWSLCVQQTRTEPGDAWAQAWIQEIHRRYWCCLKMQVHLSVVLWVRDTDNLLAWHAKTLALCW